MDIGKISYYSRKIHRWSLWFVVGFGLIQMTTGLTMKHPETFFFFNEVNARTFHRQTATWFVAAFGVQMITGLVLHITLWILRIRR